MSKATATTTAATPKVAATATMAVPESVVYVGPSILGVAYHNTVYNNGLPQELQAAIEKEPAFKNLIVPISQLSSVGSDIANKRGAAYIFYEKALKYKEEMKNNS